MGKSKYRLKLYMDKEYFLQNRQIIADLSVTFWSIKKYANKLIAENKLEDKSRPLISNITKFENILKSLNIEIIDYTNQKYNEGMNVNIIDTKRTDVQTDMISETIEPSVIINGELVKKASVIKEISRSKNE